MTAVVAAVEPGIASLDPDIRASLILKAAHLLDIDPAVLSIPDVRRGLSSVHPLIFAVIYLGHHLVDETGEMTFADLHVDLCELAAREWTQPNPLKGSRNAIIAPRESGKSTFAYLALPLWAAAHGHSHYVAAFSDTAGQAHRHLRSFKRELDTNARLRTDYPSLCAPEKRGRGQTVSDRQDEYAASSGFRFVAMGIDGPASGLKDGERRPDLILLDDIEGGAGTYTLYEAEKRLETLRNTIFYLNLRARVLLTGTTTVSGGIIHQLQQETEDWVDSEEMRTHYYPALYRDEAGVERSVWPRKWSVSWLRQERATNKREFARNMQNKPVPINSEYWNSRDFRYGRLESTSRCILAVDPAVTTRRSSDETGVAVVSYSHAERMACVEHVTGVRMKGEPLRQLVIDLIRRHPQVTEVCVERNNGGELMVESVFHHMPVPVTMVHNTTKKEVRFEHVLSVYRRGGVLHADRLPELEQQMLEVPNGLHDDQVDAVCIAIAKFASGTPPPTRLKSTVR